MKKALAILMALAMVAVAVYAEDAASYGNMAAVAVTGNATLTWGQDLETKANGFKNGAEWKIQIPLLAKQTFTHKGEGDSYAEISIVDAQYMIEGKHDAGKGEYRDDSFTGGDKKIDKVEAKLVFGNIYVTINKAPGFKSNNAEIWAPIKNDGYFDGSKDAYMPWGGDTTSAAADAKEGRLLRFEPGFDAAGTKIGYKTDKFDVGVKIGSKNNWEVTEGRSLYAFGLDASVTPSEMISAAATVNYANWKATKTYVGDDGKTKTQDYILDLGAKVTVKPITDLTLTAAIDAGNDYIAFTGQTDSEAGKEKFVFAYDALVSAKYKFVEAGLYVAGPGSYNDSAIIPGIDVNGKDKYLNDITDISVYGKVTDGDFVENLDVSATVMAYSMLTAWSDFENDDNKKPLATPLAFGFESSYKYAMNDVNYLKPFFNIWGQNNMTIAGADAYEMIKLGNYTFDNTLQTAWEAGADYGLFSNAVVTAKFAKGSNDNKNERFDLIKTAQSRDAGRFTLACKVTY